MKRGSLALASGLLLAIACGSFARQQAGAPVLVEPSGLERRQDLVGREVVVDDRVAYYVPRNGSEDDELQLKRTPVTFRVPRNLRPASTTRMTAALVRGVLERDGNRLVCRVTSLELKPGDLERLKAAVDQLGARDYQTRRAWARWAERRASEFKDDALMRRAKALEAEVLRLEGDVKRGAVDAPEEWLEMAREARRRKVPEPGPSAQAHRAFRARLASAADAGSLRKLLDDVKSFLPAAPDDRGAARIGLGRWEGPYADEPAETYLSAPPDVRKALDRRIWADAQNRLMDLEPIPDLATGIARSEQAAGLLPERPELPARLLEKGLAASRRELATLRLDEVKVLAEAYRARVRRPDEAQKVLRDWLEIRRSRLSDTDAEGRVALAVLYEDLLQDRVTGVELLRKAWEIDPNSKETAEAFRTRGYRKAKDQWVEADAPGGPAPSGDGANPARPAASTTQSLLGLTPDELQEKLIAKPSFKSYVAAGGKLIEQRVYLDTGSVRYVNLLHAPGESRPKVIADYTLPRLGQKGGPAPAR